MLDRLTGIPIFGVEERPDPTSTTPGEVAAKTQPFPLKPPALVKQRVTEQDIDLSCVERFRKLRNEGIFTPTSEQAV